MRPILIIAIVLLVLVVVSYFAMRGWAANAPQPSNIGHTDGVFAPCPSSPNCVSTQHSGAYPQADPLPFSGSIREAKAKLMSVVASMPKTELITEDDNYLHYVFRSPTIGFPDDVQFYFDEAAGVIHFRSSSRLGYGDANANTTRMNAVRAAWDG